MVEGKKKCDRWDAFICHRNQNRIEVITIKISKYTINIRYQIGLDDGEQIVLFVCQTSGGLLSSRRLDFVFMFLSLTLSI